MEYIAALARTMVTRCLSTSHLVITEGKIAYRDSRTSGVVEVMRSAYSNHVGRREFTPVRRTRDDVIRATCEPTIFLPALRLIRKENRAERFVFPPCSPTPTPRVHSTGSSIKSPPQASSTTLPADILKLLGASASTAAGTSASP